MILISDGEDHEEGTSEAVKDAIEKGIIIYTIGIGSLEGVQIPTNKGFVKDNEGKTVISKLNEFDLKKIASEGQKLQMLLERKQSQFDFLNNKQGSKSSRLLSKEIFLF